MLCYIYSVSMHLAFLFGIEKALDSWSLGFFVIPVVFIFPSVHLKHSKEIRAIISVKFGHATRLRLLVIMHFIYSLYNLGLFVIDASNLLEDKLNGEIIVALMYSSMMMLASFYFVLYFLFGRSKDKFGRYRIVAEDAEGSGDRF